MLLGSRNGVGSFKNIHLKWNSFNYSKTHVRSNRYYSKWLFNHNYTSNNGKTRNFHKNIPNLFSNIDLIQNKKLFHSNLNLSFNNTKNKNHDKKQEYTHNENTNNTNNDNNHSNRFNLLKYGLIRVSKFSLGFIFSIGSILGIYYIFDNEGCKFLIIGCQRVSNTIITAVNCIMDYYLTLYIKNGNFLNYFNKQDVNQSDKVIDAINTLINSSTKKSDDNLLLLNNSPSENDIKQDQLLHECHQRCAERILDLCKKNGGVFIKLGQHLSSMVLLMPNEYIKTLVQLQDQCPITSFEKVCEVIRTDLNIEPLEYFSKLDSEPLGTASLAQVHFGTIRENNQEVVIKVQHPSLLERAPVDIELVVLLNKIVKRIFPEYQLDWLADEVKRFLPIELNFNYEKQNALLMKNKYFKNDPILKIPNIYKSSKRVIIMERMYGVKINNLEYIKKNDISCYEISSELTRIYSEMIFKNGFIHCDPHPGNIFINVRKDKDTLINKILRFFKLSRGTPFDIILLDHGQYSKLSNAFRLAYAHMWNSILLGDEKQMYIYTKKLFVNTNRMNRDHIAYHKLFASMVSGRSWDNIIPESNKANNVENKTINHKATSGGITNIRSKEEIELLKSKIQEKAFHISIVDILSKVHPDLIMLLKTNDLLRGIDDVLLGDGIGLGIGGDRFKSSVQIARSLCLMGKYCSNTIKEESINQILLKRNNNKNNDINDIKNKDEDDIIGLWNDREEFKLQNDDYIEFINDSNNINTYNNNYNNSIFNQIYLLFNYDYWKIIKNYWIISFRLQGLKLLIHFWDLEIAIKELIL